MPLQKGHSPAVVSKNVKEMVASGMPVKQAIAAALSKKRMSMKMMAEGGEVDDNIEDQDRTLEEINLQGQYHPAEVANPKEENEDSMLAKALHAKAEGEEVEGYAMGGEVEVQEDGENGNMPDEMMAADTGESMASEPMKPQGEMEMSEAAKEAIAMKKKNRRYV